MFVASGVGDHRADGRQYIVYIREMAALVESHRRALEKFTAHAKRELSGLEEQVWTGPMIVQGGRPSAE